MLVVRHGEVSGIEEWCFRRVNELPDALYPLVWPFQQIGVLAVGPVVAIVALVLHHRRLALAALIVTVLKLGSERAVKAFVSRQRPGTSIGADITLARRRPPRRRELRLRPCRAGRRPRRRDLAVPARPMALGAVGVRGRRDVRPGLRRGAQPPRRRVWSRARCGDRRRRAPGRYASRGPHPKPIRTRPSAAAPSPRSTRIGRLVAACSR